LTSILLLLLLLGGCRGPRSKVGLVFIRIDKLLFLDILLFSMRGAGAMSD
jgi:hypothetical protein